MKKIVIVGGNAVGMSSAARLNRLNKDLEITLLEKSGDISFSNCSMPYVVGGVLESRNDILITSQETAKNDFGIDLRMYSEVTKIDKENKTVLVRDHRLNKEYELDYDILILGLGGKPVLIPFEGIDKADNVFTLTRISDLDRLTDYMQTRTPKTAAIIGAGPIGIEVAENLNKKGLNVHVYDLSSQILGVYDVDMAQIIEKELTKHGVEIHTGVSISKVEDNGHKLVLTDDSTLETDMIIMAIGVKPNTQIAEEAGLEIGETKGIVIDEYCKTSNPYIYAGGDCAQILNRVNNNSFVLALGGPANRQGRIIANHIMGDTRTYDGSVGTSVIKVYDKIISGTGLSHKQALKDGYDAVAVHVTMTNHSPIMPDACPITYKLIFDKDTTRVLGAQAVGQEGTEKRVDVTATAIYFNAKINDLINLDLAYAPPVSLAKDHVNIAGQIAQNIVDDIYTPFYPKDIKKVVEKGINIIDVRPKAIYETFGCEIANSVNIPYDTIEANLDKIDFDHDVYITCNQGRTGYNTALLLRKLGFENKIYNLSGGMLFYQEVKK